MKNPTAEEVGNPTIELTPKGAAYCEWRDAIGWLTEVDALGSFGAGWDAAMRHVETAYRADLPATKVEGA